MFNTNTVQRVGKQITGKLVTELKNFNMSKQECMDNSHHKKIIHFPL